MKASCPSEHGRASISIADLPSAGNDNGNVSGWRTAESSPTMKNGSRQLNNAAQGKPVCTLCGKTAHTYQALTCAGCGSNLRHTTMGGSVNNNEDAVVDLKKCRKGVGNSSLPIAEREPLDTAVPPSYGATTFKVSKIVGTGNTPSTQSPRFETPDNGKLYTRPNAGGFSSNERNNSQNKKQDGSAPRPSSRQGNRFQTSPKDSPRGAPSKNPTNSQKEGEGRAASSISTKSRGGTRAAASTYSRVGETGIAHRPPSSNGLSGGTKTASNNSPRTPVSGRSNSSSSKAKPSPRAVLGFKSSRRY